MRKAHGATLLLGHKYEGAICTLSDQGQIAMVRVQRVRVPHETGFVTPERDRSVYLFQPGPVLHLQRLSHLLDRLTNLLSYEPDIQPLTCRYQMAGVQGIQGPEMTCGPCVLLCGQVKVTVGWRRFLHRIHFMVFVARVKEQVLDGVWDLNLY